MRQSIPVFIRVDSCPFVVELNGSALKFFGLLEGQTAFAIEQFAEPPVAGTGRAADDFRRYAIAGFAPGAPAREPVFPCHWFIHRNCRDSGLGKLGLPDGDRVHGVRMAELPRLASQPLP